MPHRSCKVLHEGRGKASQSHSRSSLGKDRECFPQHLIPGISARINLSGETARTVPHLRSQIFRTSKFSLLFWLTEQRNSKAKTGHTARTSPSPTWQRRRLLCQSAQRNLRTGNGISSGYALCIFLAPLRISVIPVTWDRQVRVRETCPRRSTQSATFSASPACHLD
jgi:hypothetical protein